MKSEKYDPQDEDKIKFPCLLQNDHGTVFLANEAGNGTVVFVGNGSLCRLGASVGNIQTQHMKRFLGTITLRGDE